MQGPNVLLVDDESFSLEIVAVALQHESVSLHYLSDALLATEKTKALQPYAVIVDLRMPGCDGIEVIQSLRADTKTCDVPIILLSSEDDPDIKSRAFATGTNDYLVKWPDPRELRARILYHIRAHQARLERDRAFVSLKESREKLAQSQAALHQAQKMEAIGQLTGGIAHDFNNVLQIIRGNLQLLQMTMQDTGKAGGRIESAMAGVNRGARLASHLLAFARRQPLQEQILDPGKLLADMTEMTQHILGPGIRVDTKIPDDIWHVKVDPNQLHAVVLNLAINARDAMPDGGTLTLRASNVVAGTSELNQAEDYVLLEVGDTGTGMSPQTMERAIEPFFTTKPSGEGTGLGLSMAYGFVKQSGGELILSSEENVGTVVHIYLQRCKDNLSSRGLSAPALQPGHETILVVEDEESVRATTVALLEMLGYHVLQADNAEAAIAVLKSDKADLVFSDVLMPGKITSTDLREFVQAHRPGTPMLFTSGYAEGVIVHQGKLQASVQLLQKPYSAETLSARLRLLLDGTGQ